MDTSDDEDFGLTLLTENDNRMTGAKEAPFQITYDQFLS